MRNLTEARVNPEVVRTKNFVPDATAFIINLARKALAERGVKNLAIVTPGFTADCLETLEEIAVENAEIFHHHGGKNFAAIPCLNDSEFGMKVINHVVLRELKGWVSA